MRRAFIFLSVMLSMAGTRSFAACQIGQLAQLPVTMVGLRPTVTAQINGTDAVFAIDSGAFFSLISPAAAQRLNLHLQAPPANLGVAGFGGSVRYSVANVAFNIGPFKFPHMDFIVAGNELGAGAEGLLGQNFLRIGDVDYDLANGVIRIMRPQRDCTHADLAWWAKDRIPSEMAIEGTSPLAPWARGIAYLNGKKMRVLFDTGSPLSAVSRRAAERAGITMSDPGVMSAGYTFGLGQSAVRTWIAPVESFKIGGEEIRHTHLRIADFDAGVDMYIGADFFLSHHVYVANSQHRLYFTYNGGPVFNLTAYLAGTPRNANPAQTAGSAAPALPAAAPAPPAPAGATAPTAPLQAAEDAAQLARQGAALLARGEYPAAIADLTRACQLDPSQPSYFEQRAMAELRAGQATQARADLDQTLRLKSDDVTALFARAQVRLAARDREGALSDLQMLDKTLPPQADRRRALGAMYLRVEQYQAAIRQSSLWIDAHEEDVGIPMALNQRCWARALADQELKAALADCDRAIKRGPTPQFRAAALDSRALVRLRLGDYDRSVKDYDAALKGLPRSPWSLYGRGVDELREGRASAGHADVQAAIRQDPQITEEFRRIGISP